VADAPEPDASETVDESRAECRACRGTGSVISNLGGEAKSIDCPWCEGTGKFKPGHDAQARHRDPDAPPKAEAEVD
jgi:DnaJ-class molecular chaperone